MATVYLYQAISWPQLYWFFPSIMYMPSFSKEIWHTERNAKYRKLAEMPACTTVWLRFLAFNLKRERERKRPCRTEHTRQNVQTLLCPVVLWKMTTRLPFSVFAHEWSLTYKWLLFRAVVLTIKIFKVYILIAQSRDLLVQFEFLYLVFPGGEGKGDIHSSALYIRDR